MVDRLTMGAHSGHAKKLTKLYKWDFITHAIRIRTDRSYIQVITFLYLLKPTNTFHMQVILTILTQHKNDKELTMERINY